MVVCDVIYSCDRWRAVTFLCGCRIEKQVPVVFISSTVNINSNVLDTTVLQQSFYHTTLGYYIPLLHWLASVVHIHATPDEGS